MSSCSSPFIHFGPHWLDPSKQIQTGNTAVPLNPPAPEVQGAWSSGWHKSTKVQVYLGGGPFIWKKPPVFDRSWRSPSQNTVKKQYGIDLFVASPAKPGQKKVKKPRVFQLFGFIFGFATCFFSTRWCGVARKRFFVILDPFLDSFSDFFQARNTGVYSIFVFVEVWRLSSKLLKPS